MIAHVCILHSVTNIASELVRMIEFVGPRVNVLPRILPLVQSVQNPSYALSIDIGVMSSSVLTQPHGKEEKPVRRECFRELGMDRY